MSESAQPIVAVYSTAKQKEEIIRLLNNPLVARWEKTKILVNLNRFTTDRAEHCIQNLLGAIARREAGELIPEVEQALVAVSARTYSFYDLLQCSNREVMMREKVYPYRVQNRKMTQGEADKETELMTRISAILHGLADGTLLLTNAQGNPIIEAQPDLYK